jgi:hypothetical protein
MKWLAWLLLLGATVATAGEQVTVCYNYGCLSEAKVVYSDAQLRRVRALLGDARSDAHERALIGVAVGWMLGWAGKQSPISADRGGNYADDGVHGRMDCIDHSTTTARLLRMFERRRWLRFHRVLEPALRTNFFIFQHYSAQIEDLEVGKGEPLRYVVDSWFVDNGQPAVVIPLVEWQAGGGPEVEYERK